MYYTYVLTAFYYSLGELKYILFLEMAFQPPSLHRHIDTLTCVQAHTSHLALIKISPCNLRHFLQLNRKFENIPRD